MSEISKLGIISSNPGIRRDGTELDGNEYVDGQWVRFQRGRPKKIGGYKKSSDRLSGPVRSVIVWSRGDLNNVFCFSPFKIENIQVDSNGAGSSIVDLTPLTDFTGDDQYLWSVSSIFDAAVGSDKTLILAVPTKTISNIDDNTEHALLFAPADGSSEFEVVSDSNGIASGGVFVTNPYTVLYGKDGKVTWSNANEPQNYTTGDAGSARVTSSKIVQGLPIKSGSGPAGLLWSLDSLIRMEYVGGQAIFRFPRVGTCSIIAQNSVIEYDSNFYWIGIDRFFVTNGAQVEELPNNMNLNWFFDNLNYAHRNKIWAMRNTRFGEIWWFYPRGENTECSHAIILNVREKLWYDCELDRSAGYSSQVLRYPLMVSSNFNRNRLIEYTIVTGEFVVGNIIKGSTSGAIASILADTGTHYQVRLANETEFSEGETITKISEDAIPGTTDQATVDSIEELYTMFTHENGRNAVVDDEQAIESYFVTADFGLPINQSLNRLTNEVRVEPDFIQSGPMEMTIIGQDYANSEKQESGPYVFYDATEKIDVRVQMRHIQLKFSSNYLDGFYEMGKPLNWSEPGDARP